MKPKPGSSHLKFFLQAVFEKAKQQFKLIFSVAGFAFAANNMTQIVQHFSSQPKAPAAPVEEIAEVQQEETPVFSGAGFRAPSSVEDKKQNISDSRLPAAISESPAVPGINPGLDPEVGSLPDSARPISPYLSNYGNTIPSDPGSASRSPGSKAASKDAAKSEDLLVGSGPSGGASGVLSGEGSLGGGSSGSGSGSQASSGTLGTTTKAQAGFQVMTGGGVCTGTNIKATVSVGEIMGPAILNGTGVTLISGMTGVLYTQ